MSINHITTNLFNAIKENDLPKSIHFLKQIYLDNSDETSVINEFSGAYFPSGQDKDTFENEYLISFVQRVGGSSIKEELFSFYVNQYTKDIKELFGLLYLMVAHTKCDISNYDAILNKFPHSLNNNQYWINPKFHYYFSKNIVSQENSIPFLKKYNLLLKLTSNDYKDFVEEILTNGSYDTLYAFYKENPRQTLLACVEYFNVDKVDEKPIKSFYQLYENLNLIFKKFTYTTIEKTLEKNQDKHIKPNSFLLQMKTDLENINTYEALKKEKKITHYDKKMKI